MNQTYLGSFNVDLVSNQSSSSNSDGHKTFHFKDSVIVPSNMHLMCGLTQLNLPFWYYDFRETNNTFTVTSNISDVIVSEVITIPIGNYSLSNFCSVLNVLFAAAASSLGVLITSISDTTTSKLLFSTTPTIDSITFSDVLPYRQMGFNNSDFVVENQSTFYAPNMYDFAGSPCLYVRLHNKGLKNKNSNNNFSGILTCIPIRVYPNEIIFYYNSQPQFFRTNMTNLNDLEISLLDENFETINDLNGAIWRMTLTFDYHYNHEVIHPVYLSDNLDKNETEDNVK